MTDPTSSPTISDPLLTAQQVAGFLGASLRTIQRRIADGSIRTLKLGRIIRIPASEMACAAEWNRNRHKADCCWPATVSCNEIPL